MPIVGGTYLVYTVQPGDTLYSIANRFGSNVTGISQINAIFPPFFEPGIIYPGHQIIVPVSAGTESQVFYVVKPGDTLYSIAGNFLLSVNELMNANPQLINPELIHPYQTIQIPVHVFAVSTGDSLYSIGQQLGVNVQDIIQLNQQRPGFSPQVLPAGYGLLVPQS